MSAYTINRLRIDKVGQELHWVGCMLLYAEEFAANFHGFCDDHFFHV